MEGMGGVRIRKRMSNRCPLRCILCVTSSPRPFNSFTTVHAFWRKTLLELRADNFCIGTKIETTAVFWGLSKHVASRLPRVIFRGSSVASTAATVAVVTAPNVAYSDHVRRHDHLLCLSPPPPLARYHLTRRKSLARRRRREQWWRGGFCR